MEIPTSKTPVHKCIKLALYASAMLGKFTKNATLAMLAPKLSNARQNLSDKQNAYAAAVMAMIFTRVEVRYADYTSDDVVRRSQRSAANADDLLHTGGKIVAVLFPDGTTPIIKPVGQTQVDEMIKLEGRYDLVASMWPEAQAEKTKLSASRAAYEAALKARKEGMETVANLRAARDLAKEEFLDVYAETASRVKAEFPRNKPMQDLFFDEVSAGRGSSGGEEEEDDAPDGGQAGGGTPEGGQPA